jgi:hypothetical protein
MKKNILLCFLSLIFISCGSMTYNKKEDKVSKIHKVAVIATEIDQTAAKELSLNLGSNKLEGGSGGSMINQYSDHADKILKSFSDINKMKTQSAYQANYEKLMKGWHNRMPPGAEINRFLIKDLLDTQAVRIMGQEGRDQLIKDLAVDAIVVINIRLLIESTTFMGIGNRYPYTMATMSVYTLGEEAPVWFDSTLKSQISKTSVGKTGFFDEDLFKKLSIETSAEAFKQIGNKH